MKTYAKPRQDYRFLGTGIRLDSKTAYPVIAATNQPKWREERLVFILEDLAEPDHSMGCLLSADEVEFEDGATFETLAD